MIIRLKNTLAMALLSGFLFFSCNQDAIFFDISVETEPKDPRIEGSPTNIVVSKVGGAESAVYAASIGSSKIHRYKNGNWTTFSAPGGAIGQLAATDNNTNSYLYAISRNNTVYRINSNGNADVNASPGGTLQSVYGAGSKVFVGRGSVDNYSVVCYDDSTFPSSSPGDLSSVSGLLTGAAWDGANYYIATTSGIYKINSSNTVESESVPGHFMGIICVTDYIIAITHDGTLHYFTHASSWLPSVVSERSLSGGPYTGAMSPWSPDGTGTKELLLLGVIGSSMTRGYREVTLTIRGAPSGSVATPGSTSTSSVGNKARYEAAIGKHAVYSILQVPNTVEILSGKPVIFASTYKNGLWSLRGDEWNAEE
jgi:hypothetical protein